jgi:hypothetical protein
MALITVTNNGDQLLQDRYDGTDFLFQPGASINIPEEAARHIFGFGDPDKLPYLVRQGWARSSDKLNEGLSVLKNFAFDYADAIHALPAEEMEEDEEVPAQKTALNAADFN